MNEIIQANSMIDLLKKLDLKSVTALMTNIGGFIIALFLGYIIYDLSSTKITNVANAVTTLTDTVNSNNKAFVEAITKNTEVIDGNTRVSQQQSQLLQQVLINMRR